MFFTTWDAVSTLDRMLDDVMGSSLEAATSSRAFSPAIDVCATDDEVVLHCDVPGLKIDDLEVTVENHVLTIKGTRKLEARENEHRMLGRPYGSFARSITLPDYVDDEAMSATLADGVLTLRVPKHAQAKPRRIHIGDGGDGGAKSPAKQLNG